MPLKCYVLFTTTLKELADRKAKEDFCLRVHAETYWKPSEFLFREALFSSEEDSMLDIHTNIMCLSRRNPYSLCG